MLAQIQWHLIGERIATIADIEGNGPISLFAPKTARASFLTHRFPAMFNVILIRNPI